MPLGWKRNQNCPRLLCVHVLQHPVAERLWHFVGLADFDLQFVFQIVVRLALVTGTLLGELMDHDVIRQDSGGEVTSIFEGLIKFLDVTGVLLLERLEHGDDIPEARKPHSG